MPASCDNDSGGDAILRIAVIFAIGGVSPEKFDWQQTVLDRGRMSMSAVVR